MVDCEMAQAQKARWAKVQKESPGVAKTTDSAPDKAHHVAVCTPKDCSGAAGEVGAGEGGVEPNSSEMLEPAMVHYSET